eukprot:1397226-Rhodomonas_salina.1
MHGTCPCAARTVPHKTGPSRRETRQCRHAHTLSRSQTHRSTNTHTLSLAHTSLSRIEARFWVTAFAFGACANLPEAEALVRVARQQPVAHERLLHFSDNTHHRSCRSKSQNQMQETTFVVSLPSQGSSHRTYIVMRDAWRVMRNERFETSDKSS